MIGSPVVWSACVVRRSRPVVSKAPSALSAVVEAR
jgi:hypothetical protein